MNTKKEKSNEEYVRSWERQIRLIDIDETLLKSSKEKLKRAITFLRKEFGENFLKDSKNNSHFLVRKLIHERGETVYQWILWFVDSYKQIQSISTKDDELLKKLRNELGGSNSVLAELVHIDKFLRSDYFDSKMYPKRKKDGVKKSKHPDLEVKIKHNNFIFDVEIKKMKPKEGLKAFLKTWMLLHEPFFKLEVNRIYISFSFVLLTPDIAESEIAKINNQIESDIKEVVENESVKYFEIDHLIKYVIGHVKLQDVVIKWCRENSSLLNNVILIPDLLNPAITSVKGKIANDIMKGNLAHSDYGMGIINDENIFVLSYLEETKDYRKAIVNIQQSILKFTNLIGIVLSSGLFFTFAPQKSIETDEYVIICNKDDPNNLYYIIIWNSNLDITFSKADKQAIIRAFKSDITKRIHKLRK